MLENLFPEDSNISVANPAGRNVDGEFIFDTEIKGYAREIFMTALQLEQFLGGVKANIVFIIKGITLIKDGAQIQYSGSEYTVKRLRRLESLQGDFEGYRVAV